jgi:hypothetical protein
LGDLKSPVLEWVNCSHCTGRLKNVDSWMSRVKDSIFLTAVV